MSAAVLDIPRESTIDTRQFRDALGQFATGVVIISTEVEGQPYAMTANAFMSGSLEPPLIVVSVAHSARMHARITASRRFGVSILAAEQHDWSNHFAGKPGSTLVPVFEVLDGLPVMGGALVQIAAQVQHAYPCGDHTLFVGLVNALQQTQKKERPLLFQSGKYQYLTEVFSA